MQQLLFSSNKIPISAERRRTEEAGRKMHTAEVTQQLAVDTQQALQESIRQMQENRKQMQELKEHHNRLIDEKLAEQKISSEKRFVCELTQLKDEMTQLQEQRKSPRNTAGDNVFPNCRFLAFLDIFVQNSNFCSLFLP